MSGFWSAWVIVLAAITLGIVSFLFVWANSVRIPTHEDGTTGHVWAHGTLREAVRRLPLWWVLTSVGALLVGLVYLALYPALGNFPGLLGWTSQGQLQRDNAANNARLAALLEPTRGMSIEQLAENRGAVELGHRLYQDNCAACHGRKGHGNNAIGAPDLTDADWLYGGSGEIILTSILDGRSGAMPPWEAILGHDGVNAVASYVLSRNGVQVPDDWVTAGKPRFDSLCAACHGADGRGNPALGAPNLVDRAWLYGSDFASVVTSIGAGRNGVMPPWRARLSSDEARVIAAWVFAQSRHAAASK
jgi:cytochrome c oxidase cbb3-type subunit 3